MNGKRRGRGKMAKVKTRRGRHRLVHAHDIRSGNSGRQNDISLRHGRHAGKRYGYSERHSWREADETGGAAEWGPAPRQSGASFCVVPQSTIACSVRDRLGT